MDRALRIGIVAGEKSGDLLAAGLIEEIKKTHPAAEFGGLAAQASIAKGFNSIADMERLSVMGLIEPLKRLPDLLALRRELLHHFLHWQPNVVVGIDSPDFNLGLEKNVKTARHQDLPLCVPLRVGVATGQGENTKTCRRPCISITAL